MRVFLAFRKLYLVQKVKCNRIYSVFKLGRVTDTNFSELMECEESGHGPTPSHFSHEISQYI